MNGAREAMGARERGQAGCGSVALPCTISCALYVRMVIPKYNIPYAALSVGKWNRTAYGVEEDGRRGQIWWSVLRSMLEESLVLFRVVDPSMGPRSLSQTQVVLFDF